MSRQFLSAIVVMLLWPADQPPAQAPNVVTTESTVKATVDRIERSIRVVTLRQEGNVFQSVYVDPKVAGFDDLKVGDSSPCATWSPSSSRCAQGRRSVTSATRLKRPGRPATTR